MWSLPGEIFKGIVIRGWKQSTFQIMSLVDRKLCKNNFICFVFPSLFISHPFQVTFIITKSIHATLSPWVEDNGGRNTCSTTAETPVVTNSRRFRNLLLFAPNYCNKSFLSHQQLAESIGIISGMPRRSSHHWSRSSRPNALLPISSLSCSTTALLPAVHLANMGRNSSQLIQV